MSPFFVLIRPQTLLLTTSVILSGNALACVYGRWQFLTFFLTLLTALSLQTLANIANDYGDGVRGTDEHRASYAPKRVTASGLVTVNKVRQYLYANIVISIVLGSFLLWKSSASGQILIFFLLGGFSVFAAITYSIGRYAYGYYALGEVSVFLFFGWVGLLGSYILHQNTLYTVLWWPATGIGMLASAVLNLNNLRDIKTDKYSSKTTLAQILGFRGGCYLHIFLVSLGIFCYSLFAFVSTILRSAIWVVLLPFLIKHLYRVWIAHTSEQIAYEFPIYVRLVFGMSVLFSLGLIL